MAKKTASNLITQQKHTRKQGLYLESSPARLTPKDIEDTVNLCLENIPQKPAATIALVVLTTGAGYDALIKRFSGSNGELLFKMINEPPSYTKGYHIEGNSADAFIAAPAELLGAFLLSLAMSPSEKEINQFISDGLDQRFQRVTLKRLQRHLAFEASNYGISGAELAFITDTPLDSIPLNHYARFNLSNVNKKLQCYQQHLFAIAPQKRITAPVYAPEGTFGSNRVLTTLAVKSICAWYANQLPSQCTTLDQITHIFNLYTSYVITYLNLETLHRPNNDQFGDLGNFDLISRSIIVRDKGGASGRTMPLSPNAIKVIENYLLFMRTLLPRLRLLENKTYQQIKEILDGKIPLFVRFAKKGLFTYTAAKDALISNYQLPIPNNWQRHYGINYLASQGVSFDDIQLFIGHDPASVTQHDIVSGFESEKLKSLSNKLALHITNDLCMPVSLYELALLRDTTI
jgi:hypothetical protein